MNFRLVLVVLAAGLAALGPGHADETEVLGPDAAACAPESGGTAALVTVSGFKDRSGNVRLQLYPDNEKDFLRSGKKLTAEGKVFRRVETPMPADGDAVICIKLPQPGRFSMAVLHDRNADGKLNIFSDGFGFPNNPKVRLGTPDVEKVTFTAAQGLTPLAITVGYLGGRSQTAKRP